MRLKTSSYPRKKIISTLQQGEGGVLGIPFDEGSPFLPGSRFGPRGIREHPLRSPAEAPLYDPDTGEPLAAMHSNRVCEGLNEGARGLRRHQDERSAHRAPRNIFGVKRIKPCAGYPSNAKPPVPWRAAHALTCR